MNMSVNDLNEFMSLSLIDLLSGPYENKLAAALSKSRSPNQTLSPQLLHIISNFLESAEEQWNEVLRRLLKNNLTYGYQTAIGYDWMLPLLCEVGIEQAGQGVKDGLWGRIKNMLLQRNGQMVNKDLLLICALSTFLNSLLKTSDKYLHRIFVDLGYLVERLDGLLVWSDVGYGDGLLEQKIGLKCHYESNRLLVGLVGLIEKMQEIGIRKNCLNDYQKILGGLRGGEMRVENYMQLLWKYLPILMKTLMCMSILNVDRKQGKFYMNLNGKILKEMMCQKNFRLDQNFIKAWKVLLGLCNIGRFGRICEIKGMGDFIRFICNVDLILINNYHDLGQELKYLSEQIFSKTFSDTLSGCFLRAILSLCKNIPCFFNEFLKCLMNKFKQISNNLQDLSKLDVNRKVTQLMSFLLKIGLFSDVELMLFRRQEIERAMKQIIEVLSKYWDVFGDMEQMQILRCFISFVGKKQGDGIWGEQFGEDLVKKCIELCLISLRIHEADEQNFSLLQQQSKQILLSLPQTSNIRRVLRSALPAYLLQIFMGFPVGSQTCVQIFNVYVVNVPEIVCRDSSRVVWYYVDGFKWAMEGYLSSKNRVGVVGYGFKDVEKRRGRLYGLINRILDGLMSVLQMGQDMNGQDLYDGVMRGVLINLQNPLQIDCEEGLLRLLQSYLMKYPHFSSQLAMMICKFPVLYEKNGHRLQFLHGMYRVLGIQKQIVSEVVYEYDEVILVMLRMVKDYVDYLGRLQLDEILLYQQGLRGFIGDMLIFVQGYGYKIMEDERMGGLLCGGIFEGFYLLEKKVYGDGDRLHGIFEILLHVCMTIGHMSINPCVGNLLKHPLLCTLGVVKGIGIGSYLYIQSIYMIPMLIVDQMFVWPDRHQEIVGELVGFFYKIGGEEGMGGEGGMKKQWRDIERFEYWIEWPGSSSACGKYIETVLRQMRARKVFQLFEHQKYLEVLKPFIG